MHNATTLPRQRTLRARRSVAEIRAEQAEARRMLRALRRVLERTGRYNVTVLHEALAVRGIDVRRETLDRWFNGHRAPTTTDKVEQLAIAAGVDLAYLLPDADDEPAPYELTDRGLRAVAVDR